MGAGEPEEEKKMKTFDFVVVLLVVTIVVWVTYSMVHGVRLNENCENLLKVIVV